MRVSALTAQEAANTTCAVNPDAERSTRPSTYRYQEQCTARDGRRPGPKNGSVRSSLDRAPVELHSRSMTLTDHHNALKADVIARSNAGRAEMALASLQLGKHHRALTLHANPRTFTTSGLQATDWLAYLGFQRSDRCSFIASQRCFSREVPAGFDLQAFATAFASGFAHLEKA